MHLGTDQKMPRQHHDLSSACCQPAELLNCSLTSNSTLELSQTYLAVNEQLEQCNGLLSAILIHTRHVDVIQENHEALAHGRSICIFCPLFCAVLSYQDAWVRSLANMHEMSSVPAPAGCT